MQGRWFGLHLLGIASIVQGILRKLVRQNLPHTLTHLHFLVMCKLFTMLWCRNFSRESLIVVAYFIVVMILVACLPGQLRVLLVRGIVMLFTHIPRTHTHTHPIFEGGKLFAAICSYNGGVDEAVLTDRKSNPMVSRASSLTIPVPVWLMVGENSENRARSETASKAFAELNWPCRYDVVKGGSEWPKDVIEEEILVWFLSARDEALAIHLSPKKK